MASESINSAIRDFLSSLITSNGSNPAANISEPATTIVQQEQEQQHQQEQQLLREELHQNQIVTEQQQQQQKQKQYRQVIQEQKHNPQTSEQQQRSNGVKRSRSPADESLPDAGSFKKAHREDDTNSREGSRTRRSRGGRRQRIREIELDPRTRLIARQLRGQFREYELRRHFEMYGEILEVTLKNDGAYGFVQFADVESCAAAVDEVCRGTPHALDRQSITRRGGGGGGSGVSRSRNTDTYIPDDRRGRRNEFPYRSGGGDDNNNNRDDEYRPRRQGNDNKQHNSDPSSVPKPQSGVFTSSTKRKDFPLPRRYGNSVPVAQVIAMGDADRHFISTVENTFRSHNTSIHTLFLQPDSVSRDAIVKQMIYEGVKAVIFIEKGMEIEREIYLQVFHRNNGNDTDAVRFDEYDRLHIEDAIAIVQRDHQQPAIIVPTTFGGNTIVPSPYGFTQPSSPLYPPFGSSLPVFPSPTTTGTTAPTSPQNAPNTNDALGAIVNLLRSNLASPTPTSFSSMRGNSSNCIESPTNSGSAGALLQALGLLINNNAAQQQQQQQQQALLLQQLLTQLTTGGNSSHGSVTTAGTNSFMVSPTSPSPNAQPSSVQQGQSPLMPSVNELVGKINMIAQRVQNGNGDILHQSSSSQNHSRKR
ncbi:hypothetical protein INT45_000616 [Circinella minor]|uniref:RRM domain-containing protein n=1 Tax=Circinella minor TaxID=1195481 RepID=A0A8H7VRU4_9FUNG|nr:hypothetical protein INT45_000616 [Circinella minor]